MAEKKILVVDDEPAFVRLVSKTLTHKGYEVLTAGDGQEAILTVIQPIRLETGTELLDEISGKGKLDIENQTDFDAVVVLCPNGLINLTYKFFITQNRCPELLTAIFETATFKPNVVTTFRTQRDKLQAELNMLLERLVSDRYRIREIVNRLLTTN